MNFEEMIQSMKEQLDQFDFIKEIEKAQDMHIDASDDYYLIEDAQEQASPEFVQGKTRSTMFFNRGNQ